MKPNNIKNSSQRKVEFSIFLHSLLLLLLPTLPEQGFASSDSSPRQKQKIEKVSFSLSFLDIFLQAFSVFHLSAKRRLEAVTNSLNEELSSHHPHDFRVQTGRLLSCLLSSGLLIEFYRQNECSSSLLSRPLLITFPCLFHYLFSLVFNSITSSVFPSLHYVFFLFFSI